MHIKNARAHTLSPLVSEETAGKLRAKNTVTLACAAQIVRVSFVFCALRALRNCNDRKKQRRPHEPYRANSPIRKNIGVWSALSQKILRNFSITSERNPWEIFRTICDASLESRREMSRKSAENAELKIFKQSSDWWASNFISRWTIFVLSSVKRQLIDMQGKIYLHMESVKNVYSRRVRTYYR